MNLPLAGSMLSSIERRDHLVMRRVHRWRAPRWIRLWMVWATRGGDGWLWLALAAALIALGGEAGRKAVLEAGAAGLSGVALFMMLKRMTGRRRPCHLEPHCWSTLLPPDQFSFPSGHTITAFAVTIPVGGHFPDAMPALMFCSLSIALSRVVLGMHFMSDVVAGAVIGGGLGWMIFGCF
jgi:undecaprenyl-diphosphatase